jgi:hypothetical protein
MAAKKKRVGQSAAKKVSKMPAKKAMKRASVPRPRSSSDHRTAGEVVEELKAGAKKAVKKAVKVAKRKIVEAEKAIENRIKATVSRAKKRAPARPISR